MLFYTFPLSSCPNYQLREQQCFCPTPELLDIAGDSPTFAAAAAEKLWDLRSGFQSRLSTNPAPTAEDPTPDPRLPSSEFSPSVPPLPVLPILHGHSVLFSVSFRTDLCV